MNKLINNTIENFKTMGYFHLSTSYGNDEVTIRFQYEKDSSNRIDVTITTVDEENF